MNKPLMSRWYIKLTLVILIIAVVYLMIDSFRIGKEEGEKMQAQQESN